MTRFTTDPMYLTEATSMISLPDGHDRTPKFPVTSLASTLTQPSSSQDPVTGRNLCIATWSSDILRWKYQWPMNGNQKVCLRGLPRELIYEMTWDISASSQFLASSGPTPGIERWTRGNTLRDTHHETSAVHIQRAVTSTRPDISALSSGRWFRLLMVAVLLTWILRLSLKCAFRFSTV